MPKEAPKEGQSHVVLSIKSNTGRMELSATLPSEKCSKLMEWLIETNAKAAQQAQGAQDGEG